MVKMQIEIPMLSKQYNVDVSYGDIVKSVKNRTFSNASPCCRVALKQKKICSSCETEVENNEVVEKILKIGKENIILPVERLDAIKDSIASGETTIKIKAVLGKSFNIPFHRIDGSVYITPLFLKDYKDYLELKMLCESYYLIGEATLKSNTYEVLFTMVDDVVVMIKFASQSRVNRKPNLDGLNDIALNPEIVSVMKQIMEKHKQDDYDLTEFEDTRTKQVDELIENIALGNEELPPITKVEKVAMVEENELEKLKALLVS